MNDFSEIENELHALRPVRPSQTFFQSVARELDGPEEAPKGPDNIIRPSRFHSGWFSLGLGLATAAAVLLLLQIDFFSTASRQARPIPSLTPNPAPAVSLASAEFIPADATRVVYRTEDEGLLFPRGSTGPVRRLRSRGRETLQWHNPGTGASLRVSYPSEEVQLIPVAGQ